MVEPGNLLTYAAVVLWLFLLPGPAVLLVLGRAPAGRQCNRARDRYPLHQMPGLNTSHVRHFKLQA